MPFPVSISFPPNSLPPRTSLAMSHSSGSQQNPRRAPANPLPSNSKRARPRGLWKARGSVPRPTPGTAAPPPPTPADVVHPRMMSEFDSDDDQASCSSSVLSNKRPRKHSGSDTPLSTDLDDTPHVRTLVTKHQQHHPQDYFSAFPLSQPADDSSDDDSANWITRTKLMDISTTAGPGDPSPSTTTFIYEDWLDLKQLFTKACEQYEFNNPAETLPLLRGVIHECHRCLLTYHDPSVLFVPSDDPDVHSGLAGTLSDLEPPTPKTQGTPNPPVDLPTAFHSLLGTTLFYFANSIAANPELALPGEPANPVPYWIAALDVFESGENLPSRIDRYTPSLTFAFQAQTDEYDSPIHEDWRMAVMWGRTLVSLATEMVDRNRGKPPPLPETQVFSSPIPTNADYLKTGTIWDDEPQWPRESPFGVITARRPPITRRMSLNDATPHEILQLAMDHFSRGIFHMPHNSSSAASAYPPASRQPALPQFTRTKALYEIADEVLLLAEKLEDPEERKEWATYADSVFSQIHLSLPYRFQEHSLVSSSLSRDTSDSRPPISEGMVAKARGQAWLAIGSTIAEAIEERMDQDSESDAALGALIQSEEAEEARDALARAVEFFERAAVFIGREPEIFDEEEVEVKDNGDDDDNDSMIVDDNDDDDADDEQEPTASMSARARGKQRQDMRTEETRRSSRLEASRISRLDARKLRQQEAVAEKRQLSHLLAEALCSLANLTESRPQQEEYYRRAEVETGSDLFGVVHDDGMDEDR